MERSVMAFAVREFSSDAVLVTYRATRRDPVSGRERLIAVGGALVPRYRVQERRI